MKSSIRDLLLVTFIVGLAVGWWLDRSKLADQLKPRYKTLGIYSGHEDTGDY